MKKTTLIPLAAVLMAVAAGAQAAWTVVAPLEANNGKGALYVDEESIQKQGQRVRFWTLYDLPADAPLIVRDKEVRSIRDEVEVDCANATYASTGSRYNDGQMGTGQVVLALGAAAEEELLPNTALAAFARKACPAR